MHRVTQLSESRTFQFENAERDPEIYDVWPFHMPTLDRDASHVRAHV